MNKYTIHRCMIVLLCINMCILARDFSRKVCKTDAECAGLIQCDDNSQPRCVNGKCVCAQGDFAYVICKNKPFICPESTECPREDQVSVCSSEEIAAGAVTEAGDRTVCVCKARVK